MSKAAWGCQHASESGVRLPLDSQPPDGSPEYTYNGGLTACEQDYNLGIPLVP